MTVPNTTSALNYAATNGGVPSGTWSVVVNDYAAECTAIGAPACVVGDGTTTYPPGRYDVTVLLKPGPVAATGTMDVNLYLVTNRYTAATAATDASMTRMRADALDLPVPRRDHPGDGDLRGRLTGGEGPLRGRGERRRPRPLRRGGHRAPPGPGGHGDEPLPREQPELADRRVHGGRPGRHHPRTGHGGGDGGERRAGLDRQPGLPEHPDVLPGSDRPGRLRRRLHGLHRRPRDRALPRPLPREREHRDALRPGEGHAHLPVQPLRADGQRANCYAGTFTAHHLRGGQRRLHEAAHRPGQHLRRRATTSCSGWWTARSPPGPSPPSRRASSGRARPSDRSPPCTPPSRSSPPPSSSPPARPTPRSAPTPRRCSAPSTVPSPPSGGGRSALRRLDVLAEVAASGDRMPSMRSKALGALAAGGPGPGRAAGPRPRRLGRRAAHGAGDGGARPGQDASRRPGSARRSPRCCGRRPTRRCARSRPRPWRATRPELACAEVMDQVVARAGRRPGRLRAGRDRSAPGASGRRAGRALRWCPRRSLPSRRRGRPPASPARRRCRRSGSGCCACGGAPGRRRSRGWRAPAPTPPRPCPPPRR